MNDVFRLANRNSSSSDFITLLVILWTEPNRLRVMFCDFPKQQQHFFHNIVVNFVFLMRAYLKCNWIWKNKYWNRQSSWTRNFSIQNSSRISCRNIKKFDKRQIVLLPYLQREKDSFQYFQKSKKFESGNLLFCGFNYSDSKSLRKTRYLFSMIL